MNEPRRITGTITFTMQPNDFVNAMSLIAALTERARQAGWNIDDLEVEFASADKEG